MCNILNIFSNRELSSIILIIIFLLFILINQKIRKSFINVLKVTIFDISIMNIILSFLVYVLIIIFIFSLKQIWNLNLLKETIFWFLSFGIVTLFKINDAKDNKFFKIIFFESIKWTIIIDFIINFFSFSLLIELILLILTIIFSLIYFYSEIMVEKDIKYRVVNKLLKIIIIIIAAIYLTNSFYKAIINFSNLLTSSNFKSFLLPTILSILTIPFYYLFSIYLNYEILYVKIDIMIQEKYLKKKLKKQIFLIAKLNLSKIIRVFKNFNKFELYQSINIRQYVINISK